MLRTLLAHRRRGSPRVTTLLLLEDELRRAERNAEIAWAARHPLADMIASGSFAYRVLPDGSELFEDGVAEIVVPKTCVRWLGAPPEVEGPTEMAPERRRLLDRLRALGMSSGTSQIQKKSPPPWKFSRM
jgi:hypothetical protein